MKGKLERGTYERTTHTHDVTQDLSHVIPFQFNHHPLVHTNLANCIALFALFFNINKQKLALSAKTFYLLTFLSRVKRLTFLSSLSLSWSTFLSPVRQHKRTNNIKFFVIPFLTANCKRHLETQHSGDWAKY